MYLYQYFKRMIPTNQCLIEALPTNYPNLPKPVPVRISPKIHQDLYLICSEL